MLRYGLAVALAAEHVLEFSAGLPALAAFHGIDAAIVDIATLRQRQNLSASDMAAIEQWPVPTVLIDQAQDRSAPTRKNLSVLTLPLTRDRLHKALFDCLYGSGAAASAVKPGKTPAAAPAKARAKKFKPTPAAASQVIELVEVVEEQVD